MRTPYTLPLDPLLVIRKKLSLHRANSVDDYNLLYIIHIYFRNNKLSFSFYLLFAPRNLNLLKLCSNYAGKLLPRKETIPDRASVHTQKWLGSGGGLMSVTERSYSPAPISKEESLVGKGVGGGYCHIWAI